VGPGGFAVGLGVGVGFGGFAVGRGVGASSLDVDELLTTGSAYQPLCQTTVPIVLETPPTHMTGNGTPNIMETPPTHVTDNGAPNTMGTVVRHSASTRFMFLFRCHASFNAATPHHDRPLKFFLVLILTIALANPHPLPVKPVYQLHE